MTSRFLPILGALLALAAPLGAQTGMSVPVRHEAQYTKFFFDDLELATPTLRPGFRLETGGSLTNTPADLVSGTRSIKGIGSGSWTNFLSTHPGTIPFVANRSYAVTFRYRVLAALDQGSYVLFYSQEAANAKYTSPSTAIQGSLGETATATLTGTLGPYGDYQVYWAIGSSGAIAIDDIRIIDTVTGNILAIEDAELVVNGPGPGLRLLGAPPSSDPSSAIEGKGSIQLSSSTSVVTDPSVVPLASNTTYIVEFAYRIVTAGSFDSLQLHMRPAAGNDPGTFVPMSPLRKNEPANGLFSSGAQTAAAGPYVIFITASPGAVVVIDDVSIYRQEVRQTSERPARWDRLSTLPFPRLGNYTGGVQGQAYQPEGTPYPYTTGEFEKKLAFSDVIISLAPDLQTVGPDSIRRLRQWNPNLVLLPGIPFGDNFVDLGPIVDARTNIIYELQRGMPDEWYVRTSTGEYATGSEGYNLRAMNVSEFCPIFNDQTYNSYLVGFVADRLFPSGLWDGIMFGILQARGDQSYADYYNPDLFDYDYNRNRLRDETPAVFNDMYFHGAKRTLEEFQARVGDSQLNVPAPGRSPDPILAPYVNGYAFECFNSYWIHRDGAAAWNDEGAWRSMLDIYLLMGKISRRPAINLMNACGADLIKPDRAYALPTEQDIQKHRFAMSTALLGDGFYEYDLFNVDSAPYWFDEYSVDEHGTAAEQPTAKGYLGAALTDAIEAPSPVDPVLVADFEAGVVPEWLAGTPQDAISITHVPGETISGNASLILHNPEYTHQTNFTVGTVPSRLPLTPGTYTVGFDWRILETLGASLKSQVYCVVNASFGLVGSYGSYGVRSVIAGTSGSTRYPVTIPAGSSNCSVFFEIANGGKVAIDNFAIYRGGAGPWRRDFENGFTLVNPLNTSHTFSPAEVAGPLNRTGIRRIKGTQAPDINNGQPVTGDLTLGPFDAIVLLADPIHLVTPVVTAVANAAGGQPEVASGSFVSIYGSNFTPLPYDDWSKSIVDGQLPMQLDGIGVMIGGKPAYIYAITPGQINVQAPDVGKGSVQVIVTSAAGASVPFSVNSQLHSPAFFPWPGNQPVATHADYTWAVKNGTFPGTTTVAAKPGEVIALWGTGFGPTNPAVPAGQVPTVAATPTQSPVTVTLGGTAVPVLGAVLSSYAAVYQIAIQIPASMADGNYALVASVNGAQSPPNILLTVQR
jgi:uncharacterized protein (TIGR03437 family)